MFGNLYRHILGPRAEDQRRMNLYFTGGSYHIGERYTDITKILFLTLFYSVLFPLGFFFASAIFTVYYWVDKFCLLRSWRQGPKLGASMSRTSAFFFKLCLLAYAIMASYFYSQFPADNACLSGSNEEDLSDYITSDSKGLVDVKLLNGNTETRVLGDDDVEGYKFCTQEIIRSGSFPALPSLQLDGTWMTDNQKLYSKMFGWTSVAVVCLICAALLKNIFMLYVYPIFKSPYKPPTYENNQQFEDVREIAAYVPQVKLPGFEFPFLLCNIEDVKMDHIGWNVPQTIKDDDNPKAGYAAYNLSCDMLSIVERQGGSITGDSPIFSIVKSYERREYESTDELQQS